MPSQRRPKNDQRGKGTLTEWMLCRPADDCFANRQGLHSHEKTMTFKDWCDGRLRTRCFHPGYECAHHIILSVLGLWTESHEPSHTACISATRQHRICAWPSWSDFSPVFPERFLVWLAVNPIAVLQFTKQDINKAIVYTFDLCASSLRRGHVNLFCIVPVWDDDPRAESEKCHFLQSQVHTVSGVLL